MRIESCFGVPWRRFPKGLLMEPLPPREWLLERAPSNEGEDPVGVLPRNAVGLLASAGGVGKTMLVSQLALLVGSGVVRPLIGQLFVTAATAGKVLLALGEESEEEVSRLLYNAADALRLSDEHRARAAANLIVLPLRGEDCALVSADPLTRQPCRTELHEELLRKLRADGPWALIVLDPLSRFSGADAMTTYFATAAEALCEVPGEPTVLLAHHTSQAARSVMELVDGGWSSSTITTVDESGGRVVQLAVAGEA